jgi:glycosyltransferase involved in cell wall biosynthesis
LLQDEIYLPSLGGGIKANRFLMEGLAQNGHRCLALTRALTRSPDGPNDRLAFLNEMTTRGKTVTNPEPNVFAYEHQGVQVEALDWPDTMAAGDYLTGRIRDFEPDWILVADDKRRAMLDIAVRVDASRTVPIVQTIMQLPFGPLSVHPDARQTALMGQACAIVAISAYLQSYIREHSQLESKLLRLPVYGPDPFADLGHFQKGCVTMINPCEMKGVSIFLELARQFPSIQFAAVPTWGADKDVLDRLNEQPNVRLLRAVDNIDQILEQTRVLLVPSLWPETFGYVVPEAMLRGIPVLASNIGGLPEAKLGVDYLLPVTPAVLEGNRYVCPPQDTAPWSQALNELLTDSEDYRRCAAESRKAATEFLPTASVSLFETFLERLEASAGD